MGTASVNPHEDFFLGVLGFANTLNNIEITTKPAQQISDQPGSTSGPLVLTYLQDLLDVFEDVHLDVPMDEIDIEIYAGLLSIRNQFEVQYGGRELTVSLKTIETQLAERLQEKKSARAGQNPAKLPKQNPAKLPKFLPLAESYVDKEHRSKIFDTWCNQLAMLSHFTQARTGKEAVYKALEELGAAYAEANPGSEIAAQIKDDITSREVNERINQGTQSTLEKAGKIHVLKIKLEETQRLLHELDPDKDEDEIETLQRKAGEAGLAGGALETFNKGIKKLKRIQGSNSQEAAVILSQLEWLVDLPWRKTALPPIDIKALAQALDEDHYGLEKVKKRIVEHFAVMARTGNSKGIVLCLVGPPGVGKTTLGRSIAKAVGRKFVRMALGGVRDEADIRGHRKTYVGAMPGKILHGMKKAETTNPLFLLDEVDKIGRDHRGDPADALLEVLDPEQNREFEDHYLQIDYDLSDVIFICTANSLNLPGPLLDRMEIIDIAGYTIEEKLEIAKRHLVRKQMEANGLRPEECSITDEAIRNYITGYTREAGVRDLDRGIGELCRKALMSILQGETTSVHVTADNLETFAGPPRNRDNALRTEPEIGVVTGLAYTSVGGDTLMIEAIVKDGREGTVTFTGKLGDVMKESVQVAENLIKDRKRIRTLGIDPEKLRQCSVHVHVPFGAIPKDGPSAGVGMFTSIVSALTGIPVRHDVAMTGEITMRGKVTAIGGLREKLQAAEWDGIKKVLIPSENIRDLDEVPDAIKDGLEIVPVSTVDEVLKHALTRIPVPLPAHESTFKLSEQFSTPWFQNPTVSVPLPGASAIKPASPGPG